MSPITYAANADPRILRDLLRGKWILLTALLVLLAGCSSVLDAPYPERATYLLEASPQQMPDPPGRAEVLAMRRFNVDPAFAGQSFVIRREGGKFSTDFYNTFLVPPAKAIASATANWLGKSGLFRAVVSGASELEPDLALEASIPALYGDFRGRPEAVLAIHFRVIGVRKGPGRIVYTANFRRAVPIAAATPAGLVHGWDTALTSILSAFEAGLNSTLSHNPNA